MRIYKPSSRHRSWHVEFSDHHHNTRRTSSFQRDRDHAKSVGDNIESLVGGRRNGDREPPARLVNWIDALDERLLAKLKAWDLIDPRWLGKRDKLRVPLIKTDEPADSRRRDDLTDECLLGQWERDMEGSGASTYHARQQARNAWMVFEACDFDCFDDIDVATVARKLAEWRKRSPKPISMRRSNAFRQACFQFCGWMSRATGVPNPLDDNVILPKLKQETDRRRVRRGLTVDEARQLITVTRGQPVRWGLTGPERAVVYHLAMCTGLRYNEIRSLRRCDFDLGDRPLVVLSAASSKRRREDILELPAELTDALIEHVGTAKVRQAVARDRREHHELAEVAGVAESVIGDFLTGKPVAAATIDKLAAAALDLDGVQLAPADRAFPLWTGKGAPMLRADLIAAELPTEDDAGHVIDFHALRHTHGEWCFAVFGMNAREAQERMRVSSLALVERYSKALRLRSSSWLARTPSLTAGDDDAARADAG